MNRTLMKKWLPVLALVGAIAAVFATLYFIKHFSDAAPPLQSMTATATLANPTPTPAPSAPARKEKLKPRVSPLPPAPYPDSYPSENEATPDKNRLQAELEEKTREMERLKNRLEIAEEQVQEFLRRAPSASIPGIVTPTPPITVPPQPPPRVSESVPAPCARVQHVSVAEASARTIAIAVRYRVECEGATLLLRGTNQASGARREWTAPLTPEQNGGKILSLARDALNLRAGDTLMYVVEVRDPQGRILNASEAKRYHLTQ